MSNNQLSFGQMYKVCDWLKANKDHVFGMSLAQAAAAAQTALGFTVTTSNITTARNETGVQIGIGRGTSNADSKADRPQIIARALIELMQELGNEPPVELVRVAKRMGQTS